MGLPVTIRGISIAASGAEFFALGPFTKNDYPIAIGILSGSTANTTLNIAIAQCATNAENIDNFRTGRNVTTQSELVSGGIRGVRINNGARPQTPVVLPLPQAQPGVPAYILVRIANADAVNATIGYIAAYQQPSVAIDAALGLPAGTGIRQGAASPPLTAPAAPRSAALNP